jgi:pimeloyl-ACP methyl ester carboxylesterase
MANTNPPPLPPRPASVASTDSDDSPITRYSRSDTIHLTPFTSSKQNNPYSVSFEDPRTSSTQSLHPVESAGPNRRTLLIIYIHGFLGNETSFKSFPAHIHNVLSTTLSETHVVHSKIYPRYKSRKNISFARDDFSKWLAPHESPSTDVILVGHSLGGILAAEVALIPASTGEYEHRHRLLGILSVDVPFLGMHPGVVSTGIASLFRSPPPEQDEAVSDPTSPSAFSDVSADSDPNFNPAFKNDIHLANRKGKLNRAWYFWNKHWGELGKATQSYVTSHLEFGGCLADYAGLHRRYDAVRALEDVDEYAHARAQNGKWLRRVRFVNYYSASTGRIKEREPSPKPEEVQKMQNLTLTPSSATRSGLSTPARTPSPRISIEEHRDGQIIQKALEEPPEDETEDLEKLEPEAMRDDDDVEGNKSGAQSLSLATTASTHTDPSLTSLSTTTSAPTFPPLDPLPPAPPPFDLSTYPSDDPATIKLAQKEHERSIKAHERLKKDREKTLRDREKLVQKHQKAVAKQKEKERVRLEKEQNKRNMTLNKEDWDQYVADSTAQRERQATSGSGAVPAGSTTLNTTSTSQAAQDAAEAWAEYRSSNLPAPSEQPSQLSQQGQMKPPPKQRDRKFCTLPKKDSHGQRDKTWIRVYMQGIDEVVAHTSMFNPNNGVYEKLVGGVCERIEGWVGEDATRRAVLEASG